MVKKDIPNKIKENPSVLKNRIINISIILMFIILSILLFSKIFIYSEKANAIINIIILLLMPIFFIL